jgi:hypothetical protein
MGTADIALRRLVSLRANGRCEYCRLPLEFDDSPASLDHIIARKHRGHTDAENLAYACYHDNNYKGDNIAGLDPLDSALTRLFNPRIDDWHEHFGFHQGEIVPRTPIARTTLYVLNVNAPVRVMARRLLMAAGDMEPE